MSMPDTNERPTQAAVDDAASAEIVDGDAATHLEALVFDGFQVAPLVASSEGIAVELVGQHLRLSGSVRIGFHRRLSDFMNNLNGLIRLDGVTILRRNGDPTRVTMPSIWVSPDEVTLVGQATEIEPAAQPSDLMQAKRSYPMIVVTPGHTLSGNVHLNPQAMIDRFIESPDPPWIPMTDVRTRSLADRRVISRYEFALLNRRHIVAATEMQPGMIRGRTVL
jgi:hypothetical protein